MTEDPVADKKTQESVMTDIVRYLQNYPFLLISIAGLTTLTAALAANLEKLREFKILLYAVILVPILLQFYLELRNAAVTKKVVQVRAEREEIRVQAQPPETSGWGVPNQNPDANRMMTFEDRIEVAQLVVVPHSLRVSKKAIFSILLAIFVGFGFLGGASDQDLINSDLQLGLLVFEAVGFGLGLSSFVDARRNKVSKPLAVMSFITSSALVLSSVVLMIAAVSTGK